MVANTRKLLLNLPSHPKLLKISLGSFAEVITMAESQPDFMVTHDTTRTKAGAKLTEKPSAIRAARLWE